MQLDADDLLARIRQDFPVQYELAQLRAMVELLQADNDRLSALNQPAFGSAVARPYIRPADGDGEGRHV